MVHVKPASRVATLAPPVPAMPENVVPKKVPGSVIECEVPTEWPVPPALKVRVPMNVPLIWDTVVEPSPE